MQDHGISAHDDEMLQEIWVHFAREHSSNDDARDFIAMQGGKASAIRKSNPRICEIAAYYMLGNNPTYDDALFILKTFHNCPALRKESAKIIMKKYSESEKTNMGFSTSLRWVLIFAPEFSDDVWKIMEQIGIDDDVLRQFMDMRHMPCSWAETLAEKSAMYYLTKNLEDNKKMRFLIWSYPYCAIEIARKILGNSPDLSDLVFLCSHAKNAGYGNAIEAGKRILSIEDENGFLKNLGSMVRAKIPDENFYAVILGYLDFIREETGNEVMAQQYYEIASQSAEIIFKRCRICLEAMIKIMECLPHLRKRALKIVCKKFGERDVRYVLYHFRAWKIVGKHIYSRRVPFDPKHDVSELSGRWLLRHGKERKSLEMVADYVPALCNQAEAKLEKMKIDPVKLFINQKDIKSG